MAPSFSDILEEEKKEFDSMLCIICIWRRDFQDRTFQAFSRNSHSEIKNSLIEFVDLETILKSKKINKIKFFFVC